MGKQSHWTGLGMEPPRTVYGQGLLAALGDMAGVMAITMGFATLVAWRTVELVWGRLMPAEPAELAIVVAAGAYFGALYYWLRSRLQRVVLGPENLTLHYNYATRHIPWSSIRRFERGPRCFRLTTTDDSLEITDSLYHAPALLANVQARLGERPPVQRFAPGRQTWLAELMAAVLPLLSFVLLASWCNARLPYARSYVPSASLLCWLVTLTLVLQAIALRRALLGRVLRWIEVDGHGLRLVWRAGRPREYAWPLVEAAASDGNALRCVAAGVVWRLPLPAETARAAAEAIQARSVLADGDRPDVFEQPPAAAGWQAAQAWLAAAVVAWLLTRAAAASMHGVLLSLRVAIAVAVGWSLAAALRGNVRRVTVTERGLVLEHEAGPREQPWEIVRGITRRGQTWRLQTSLGHVQFRGPLAGSDGLPAAVRRGMERSQARLTDAERVASDEVAGWLGIAADDCLEIRPFRARPLILGGVIWLGICLLPFVVFRMAASDPAYADGAGLLFMLAPALLFWFCYYPVHLAHLLRADALRRVYASGHGLRWRDGSAWHEAGWNEVLRVNMVPREHQQRLFYWSYDQLAADLEVLVECVGQRLRFHPKDQHAPRLQRALERLLAARRAGRAMPGLAAVPAHAISLTAPRDTAAERGLSRSGPSAPGE